MTVRRKESDVQCSIESNRVESYRVVVCISTVVCIGVFQGGIPGNGPEKGDVNK